MFGQTPSVATPPVPQRHALGLPAGSVRALLAFGVLGLSWLLVWKCGATGEKLPLEFIYLQYLGVLILAHFFAAHGSSIGPHLGTRSPLGLPRFTLRFLLVAGYIGLGVFLFMHNQMTFAEAPSGKQVLLILLLMSGFLLGYVITGVVRTFSGGTLPYWFQDIQAWFALIALLLLGVLAMWYVFIYPTLDPEHRMDLPTVEAFLAAIVGFYFGARS
jgi:hypothetical protein